jgi:hypothetical protein
MILTSLTAPSFIFLQWALFHNGHPPDRLSFGRRICRAKAGIYDHNRFEDPSPASSAVLSTRYQGSRCLPS